MKIALFLSFLAVIGFTFWGLKTFLNATEKETTFDKEELTISLKEIQDRISETEKQVKEGIEGAFEKLMSLKKTESHLKNLKK